MYHQVDAKEDQEIQIRWEYMEEGIMYTLTQYVCKMKVVFFQRV